MNNFLLEIYSEEIPSSAQKLGEKELVENFNLLFDKEGIRLSDWVNQALDNVISSKNKCKSFSNSALAS